MDDEKPTDPLGGEYDFIIVGSGAGGGPLAARLAELGRRVLVIEAGPGEPAGPPPGPSPEVSLVPALHAVSTEDPALSWRFFVRHYGERPPGVDPDPKWHTHVPSAGEDQTHDGIFYPRAAALGGCTIHNAMITIAGPDSDWDDLADFLGDDSWRAPRMRADFQRMEHNDDIDPPGPLPKSVFRRAYDSLRWLFGRGPDYARGRHGFNGWLHTSLVDLELGLADKQLLKMLKAALLQARASGLEGGWTLLHTLLRGRLQRHLDPNHADTQASSPEGVVQVPQAICGRRTTVEQNSATPNVQRGRRSSPRELLLSVRAAHPDRLVIVTDCLVTRVLFDPGDPPRAVGVELLRGARLYRAHPGPSAGPGEPGRVFVQPGGEVVLCGGAFNTPQLLTLSGIGDPAHMAELARAAGDADACALRDREGRVIHDAAGEPARVGLAGVGKNLQDRYEVSLVSGMRRDFTLLDRARFALPRENDAGDPHLREWRAEGTGLYATNGAILGLFKRSRPDLPQPDLFIFGAPLPFRGYSVNYSAVGDTHDQFSWVILKAHTRNNGGTVRLRGIDPRDTPDINFHYFNELSRPGESANDPDLLAILEGVKFVRGITRRAGRAVRDEIHPGRAVAPEGDDEKIKKWILRDAWGHHACGTCRMGPDGDELAVLDSRFRVRKVAGLRVVDASIFPNIPGYFIVTNIYMASEKAADVLHEDANSGPEASPEYPRELREREAAAIQTRRRRIVDDPLDDGVPPERSREGERSWSDDVAGLALSGGGIRSATFGLGVLQGLAKGDGLRRIDFLSTVSGGGYIGSFLGRFYDHLREDPLRGGGARPAPPPVSRVEQDLTDPASRRVGWLRRQSNYLAPRGYIDARDNVATFLRNFLAVHFVVGALLFTLFGLANAARYGLFDPATAALNLVLVPERDMPIGHLVQSLLGPFFSPWFVLFELIVLFLVLPRGVAYWIVSDDDGERFNPTGLLLMFVLGTGLVFLGAYFRLGPEPIILGVALFTSLIHVELAWRRGRIRSAAVGTGGPRTQRLRTRNYLTSDLGLAVALAGGALGFAVIDTIAHGLQQRATGNGAYVRGFASLMAAIAAATPVIRWAAVRVASGPPGAAPAQSAAGFRRQVAAGLFAVALFSLPLLLYAFASHVAYGGGTTLRTGLLATVAGLVVSVIFTHRKAVAFVNRSSLSQTYAARLARTYLGASNPTRQHGEGGDVTEVLPGDDVAPISAYRPHEAGGPLHLINMAIDQTIDFTSGRGNRERRGETFAVSPLAVSIGRHWHAAWAQAAPGEGADAVRLLPIGHEPGSDHPLLDITGRPSERVEGLSLREWIALSGAYLDPGRTQSTRLGTALLFGMANLRTGRWWDSGFSLSDRLGLPDRTFLRRLLFLAPRFFLTQSLLISEWTARFPGPWRRFWHVSDGGTLEVLGAYELIRRRVPRIIVVDASSDPAGRNEAIAELTRKAWIDFGAVVESFTDAELDQLVTDGYLPPGLRPLLTTVDGLRPGNGRPKAHAALLWVRHRDERRSVVLYLKASMTGDEAADLAGYQAAHPDFPDESTSDQFFDEAQWESYRHLGEHVSGPLLANPSWLWAIPVN